eukprot:4351213-Pyramimonas_sp.AAC.1
MEKEWSSTLLHLVCDCKRSSHFYLSLYKGGKLGTSPRARTCSVSARTSASQGSSGSSVPENKRANNTLGRLRTSWA